MRVALFVLCLSVTAHAAKPPIKIASPGLKAVGIEASKAEFYSDHLAQRLSAEPDLRCITATEIAGLIGLERQRAMLGCDENAASCVAELANALGVDAIITGAIAHVGNSYQVNVKIVSATGDASQLATASATVNNEESLLPLLTGMAEQLAVQTRRSLGLPDPHSGALRRMAWIPAVAAVIVGGVGGAFLYQSESASARLRSTGGTGGSAPPASAIDARQLADNGALDQNIGRVGVGLGAAGLVTAAIFYAFGGPEKAPAATKVAIGPGGAGLTVRF